MARPGQAPGSRPTAGTLFAALYGELVPYDWRTAGAEDSQADAYALFYQRSLAMGWLDEGSGTGVANGLWSMNDAGWDHPLVPGDRRLLSWFQVEAEAVADDRPLPVQPFLRCVQDTMDRVGVLRLDAVQLLLPVQGIDPARRPRHSPVPAAQTGQWLREGDPGTRTRVAVRINSGRSPMAAEAAAVLADRLTEVCEGAFVPLSAAETVTGPEAAVATPFDDTFWNGPPLHELRLTGTLAEWSPDAVGWLGAVVADLGAGLGVRTPLLLTAAPF
ncbi:hypothetical protein [Streptomyces sp. NPDC046887]|uniref:hypothetical protein n=1 Tax=Streptomyces sp. NPDC046887 TaxID=3155472 RepID=UPI00340EDB6D